jgi:hypothetical protein
VLIGQHVAIWGYDHSGAGTTASASCFASAAHVDADYRGADVLNRTDDCLRISVERVVVLRLWKCARPCDGIIFVQHRGEGWGEPGRISRHPTHLGEPADAAPTRVSPCAARNYPAGLRKTENSPSVAALRAWKPNAAASRAGKLNAMALRARKSNVAALTCREAQYSGATRVGKSM